MKCGNENIECENECDGKPTPYCSICDVECEHTYDGDCNNRCSKCGILGCNIMLNNTLSTLSTLRKKNPEEKSLNPLNPLKFTKSIGDNISPLNNTLDTDTGVYVCSVKYYDDTYVVVIPKNDEEPTKCSQKFYVGKGNFLKLNPFRIHADGNLDKTIYYFIVSVDSSEKVKQFDRSLIYSYNTLVNVCFANDVLKENDCGTIKWLPWILPLFDEY